MIGPSLAASGILVLAVAVFGQVPPPQQQQGGVGITDICLGCICEAISNCNVTRGCTGETCGLFGITWAYWADAGKPVLQYDNPEDPGAYPRCVTDPACASRAVAGYMAKFRQDCNGDQRIDCTDFALIHKLGPRNCQAVPDAFYWAKYSNCQQQVASLGLGNNNF